ncbi:hypothetical protein SCOR_15525 [Sulfidibacter corallicola]|uniref:Uncharacterized protein n=1 Tax=Sulfidibacter corallicola TaxID=2818388 RepID=A0A8A4TXC1_SULCO|nr:hypothetical protein [Sulfidibacter corallicola]QTD54123.1 hypothetical protein J3U87_16885 [Sulfidibacter corallicola]
MWLILCLFLWQDGSATGEDSGIRPINAQVYLPNGEKLDMVNVRLRGLNPYEFEVQGQGGSSFVSLYRILRIQRQKDGRKFELWFDTGERQVVTIKNIVFQADRTIGGDESKYLALYHTARLHFISGSQMRHCRLGHYEVHTPYPFCPVCGQELALGSYEEELDEEERPANPQIHRWRLDPRNPASGPAGGN